MKSTTTKNVSEDSKVLNENNELSNARNQSKSINQIDIETGEIVRTWPSSYAVHKELKIDRSSLSSCLRGSRKTAGGYRWEYSDPSYKYDGSTNTFTAKAVLQCDLQGNVIKKFLSVRDAAAFYDYDINEIRACTKGGRTNYKGFIWKYVNEEDKYSAPLANAKAVYQCDLEGNIIKEWSSVTLAASHFNGSSCFISDCCRGIKKQYQGYTWKYVVEEEIDVSKMRPGREIVQLDLEGNFIARHGSLAIASLLTKIPDNAIRKVLRGDRQTTHGFKFMYADDYDAKN